ncbi:MAG: AlpA family phage regulatory protein [Sphingopyxis sp.]|nr:AlpA family phage regulatory protein [Sphingopyxis sp.]
MKMKALAIAAANADEALDTTVHDQSLDADMPRSPNRDQSFPYGKLLTAAEVEQRTTLDIRTIERMVAADAFPAPVRLSPRRRAWEEAAVNRWLAAPQRWVCF